MRYACERLPLRRFGEEPAAEAPPLTELTRLKKLGDLFSVAGPDVVDSVVDAPLPAVAPPDRGVLDQVRHLDRQQRGAPGRLPIEGAHDPPAPPPLPPPMPPTPDAGQGL